MCYLYSAQFDFACGITIIIRHQFCLNIFYRGSAIFYCSRESLYIDTVTTCQEIAYIAFIHSPVKVRNNSGGCFRGRS